MPCRSTQCLNHPKHVTKKRDFYFQRPHGSSACWVYLRCAFFPAVSKGIYFFAEEKKRAAETEKMRFRFFVLGPLKKNCRGARSVGVFGAEKPTRPTQKGIRVLFVTYRAVLFLLSKKKRVRNDFR